MIVYTTTGQLTFPAILQFPSLPVVELRQPRRAAAAQQEPGAPAPRPDPAHQAR